MPRPLRLLAVFCSLLSACALPEQPLPDREQPLPDHEQPLPNIVLIISDDHAWTDYGFMGHEVIQTPNLDALAREGMLYPRGYVPTSVCRPSLATMITGLFPHEHGITGNDPPNRYDPVQRAMMVEIFEDTKTVSEYLSEKGYVSHQSGKWWEGRPQDHGFTAGMTHGVLEAGGRHGDEGLKIGREGLQPIFDFLETTGDSPFFVWYAPFLPHTPHNPPDRLLAKYQIPSRPIEVARYYAMVDWFDETVGGLLEHLDSKGYRENTIVLFVSDNGWIQPVDDQGVADTRSKLSPHDAGMRTPIMIRWPGVVEPGWDETTLVGSIDLAPTMLAAAGIEPPAEMSGLNLLDTDALADRNGLFGELFASSAVDVNDPIANLKYRYAVREDGWKLILPYAPNEDVTLRYDGQVADWMHNDVELYNVLSDPHETDNVASALPQLVEEMTNTLQQWWAVYE
jgi:arylsulfatase A-like enzyme